MAKAKESVSKPLAETAGKPSETVRVVGFFKEEGAAYGIMEIEIDADILRKHGRIAYKSNADVWGITENQLIRKAREIFGL